VMKSSVRSCSVHQNLKDIVDTRHAIKKKAAELGPRLCPVLRVDQSRLIFFQGILEGGGFSVVNG